MKILSIFVCVILFAAWSATRCQAQNDGGDLKNVRISLSVKSVTFQALVGHLQFKYGVSIGLETSARNLNEPEYYFETTPVNDVDMMGALEFPCTSKKGCFAIDVKDAELPKVLDQIVAQMKGYQWEIKDGVVNIFPNAYRNPEFERLLALKIASFRVEKGMSLYAVRKAILTTPEVASHLDEFELTDRIKLDSVRTSMRKGGLPLTEDFEVQDVTLRQLLNKLARVKSSGWSIYTIRDGLNNLELSL